MHSKIDNIEIMINEAKEVIKELFGSFKNKYQNNLELMKGCEFVFDYAHLLNYKFHKINLNRSGSIIDSPDSIKSQRNKKYLQKLTKIKPFVNKYNWEGIKFPSGKDDFNKLEKNNVNIASNVLYITKEKIYPAFLSKHNSNHEKQVTLLLH